MQPDCWWEMEFYGAAHQEDSGKDDSDHRPPVGAIVVHGAFEQGLSPMKWVTRENAKVDRVACPWLILKFIDPGAEFLYVPAAEVLATAAREGAISYDTPGARYTHRDGLCTFEVLVKEHGLDSNPAIATWPGSCMRLTWRRT